MKVSELIERLEEFRQKHGDLEVNQYEMGGRRRTVGLPVIAHKKILSGRESREEFAYKDSHRGDPVCKL